MADPGGGWSGIEAKISRQSCRRGRGGFLYTLNPFSFTTLMRFHPLPGPGSSLSVRPRAEMPAA